MQKVIDWQQTKNNITTIMAQKGITEKQLCAITHKTPSEVKRWLSSGALTVKTLVLISWALKTPLEQIIAKAE